MSAATKQSIDDARALLRQTPILVLGAGRSGCALSTEIAKASLPLLGLWNRSERDHPESLAHVNVVSGTKEPPAEWQAAARLVLIAVSDDAIASVASDLCLQPGTAVMHSSGALGSEVLTDVPAGIARGSYHPLQSFSVGSSSSGIDIPPYVVALEGDPEAVALGHALALVTGHSSLELSSQQKAGYHAAAVLASNCLVALQSAATRVMGQATGDGSQAWKLLWPLVLGTLAGLESGHPEQAITGPVARGDLRSISRNLVALSDDPLAAAIYQILGKEAVQVAQNAGLSEERARRVLEVLDPN